MNAKQKMAYHAREYRRLKYLLVGDAGGGEMAAVKKFDRTCNAQINDIDKHLAYARAARVEFYLAVKQLGDIAKQSSDPQVKKLAEQQFNELSKKIKIAERRKWHDR